ncbi:MAG: transcription-repair coupling factor, partial [Sphingomonadales bacterium]
MTPERLDHIRSAGGRLTLSGVPEGMDALVLADLAAGGGDILHIARDDTRLAAIEDALRFFAPALEIIVFPAWDCLPYDRVSPHADIAARRMATLARLAVGAPAPSGRIVLTTVNAATQRVPTPDGSRGAALNLGVGDRLDTDTLTTYLAANGYSRVGQVMEAGEYAIRGGLVDLFPASMDMPVRIDLFGDDIDSLRQFDPLSQRTTDRVD